LVPGHGEMIKMPPGSGGSRGDLLSECRCWRAILLGEFDGVGPTDGGAALLGG
jgi:hypothetical protein